MPTNEELDRLLKTRPLNEPWDPSIAALARKIAAKKARHQKYLAKLKAYQE